jgi:death-on-curing family protein
MKETKSHGGEIIIYRSKDGKAELEVNLQEETVWLNAVQISSLFEVQRPAIVKHIQNIYKTAELSPKTTCSILEQVASDGKIRKVNFYNLDAIISIGYRINSRRATQFRMWATSVLKNHILKGFTTNQKRLREKGLTELEEAVALIKHTIKAKILSDDESKGLLEVITTYASTWVMLQKYDRRDISDPKTQRSRRVFDYKFCHKAIVQIKSELMKTNKSMDLFGHEGGGQLKGILGAIHQTFNKKELYRSIEEKAAHLLYFIIKDHPFTDGNKRIGSFLFIVYLSKNNYLYRKSGEKKINDNALTALALLIAESDPKQKSLMILLIMNFLSEN